MLALRSWSGVAWYGIKFIKDIVLLALLASKMDCKHNSMMMRMTCSMLEHDHGDYTSG